MPRFRRDECRPVGAVNDTYDFHARDTLLGFRALQLVLYEPQKL